MRPAWTQNPEWSFQHHVTWTPDGCVVATRVADTGKWCVERLVDADTCTTTMIGTFDTEAEAIDSVNVQDVPDGISPGVRHLVTWLMERGFVTTDSGDGSNHRAGMECALPYANVFMVVQDPSRLISETHRLYDTLTAEGVMFANVEGETTGDEPVIECSWNPVDNVAVIALLGLSDATLWGRP